MSLPHLSDFLYLYLSSSLSVSLTHTHKRHTHTYEERIVTLMPRYVLLQNTSLASQLLTVLLEFAKYLQSWVFFF
jgi:hypothetical protein